jgi:phosphinothricin acetyltransferase
VSSRSVYAGVAEVSIYVGAAARGQGVGRVLVPKLIETAGTEQLILAAIADLQFPA